MEDVQIDELRTQIDKENAEMEMLGKAYYKAFDYRGYTLRVIRARTYSYLCGYIEMDVEEESNTYNIIDREFHGGITFNRDGMVGFDCNHSDDFNLAFYDMGMKMSDPLLMTPPNEYQTYKSIGYVEQNLKCTVDMLIDLKEGS